MNIKKVGNTVRKIVGRVVKLSDLVDYQEGSIVSKEIIRNNNGTVTLFAFDKGQGLSEHTAAFDALVYVVGGEADIFILKKRFHLKAGQMIIMPANKPHALKAKHRFKMMLIMVMAKLVLPNPVAENIKIKKEA